MAKTRPPAPAFELTETRIRRDLDALGLKEPAIKDAVLALGYPELKRRPAEFSTLARALASQQLSGKAAATIYGRVVKHCGGTADPNRLARTRVSTLRRLGLSERKAESLKTLSRAVLDGSLPLETLSGQTDPQVVETISALKGFGVWSAQMYLIFSLGRPDVWPVDDVGVRNGVQRIFGLPGHPTKKELERYGLRFEGARTAVALLCWRAVDNLLEGPPPAPDSTGLFV